MKHNVIHTRGLLESETEEHMMCINCSKIFTSHLYKEAFEEECPNHILQILEAICQGENMAKLKKEDYESVEAKDLQEQYKQQLNIDREFALAQRIVDSIPQGRKEYVLKLLSLELATKNV